MSEEILITIPKKGKIKIEVKGIKGQGCKALTEELEKALGRTTSDKPTEEMNEQPVNQLIHH